MSALLRTALPLSLSAVSLSVVSLGAVLLGAGIAFADVPVADGANLHPRTLREETAGKIEDTDNDRYAIDTSVSCSLYRGGRRNDPVGAATANPEISGLVRRIAREEGVDESQFLALVYQESRFNPCAKSSAGATGLAQLMPGTAADLGVDENNIEDNLRGGARYYRRQLCNFGGDVNLALAAYNAGPGAVSKYGGIPPFKETQGYVAAITRDWLPAFGGSGKSGIPLNYGGGETAYTAMRSSTLNAMATTKATGDSLGNVTSWYQQLAQMHTGTIQDSWDHNSTARNANLEMANNVIKLTTVMADLLNSRSAVASANLSSSSQTTQSPLRSRPPRDPPSLCDPRRNLVWDEERQICIEQREEEGDIRLMFEAN